MVVTRLPEVLRRDVLTLWEYHRIDSDLRPVDVGIGLGSHDPGVAVHAADLYRRGLFPLLVFTGANAPTTVERFPRGEAVHYREIALEHGVPDHAIRVEPKATNTGENLAFTRELLEREGVTVTSAILISRPYQQRRALATMLKIWPGVDTLCSARPQPLDDYIASIGDTDRVINMLVGDTQRIELYARKGFAAPQPIPDTVRTAYQRLVAAGYATRLIPDQPALDVPAHRPG
ncbi:YdcF family protein [Allonocardiopsis opalescens]|uniref:DUF218 domain-containing protein n=1 Tax=Allonocardiopsis opalescens TaxID=1144618 RepID=A0A2T0QCC3_9ACTN|nr:YdcF family protein [Allonocardiopsis opalescens]PRY01567.1 DUF218 domain-containing protein [Allonocardiopsis opalescens]